MLEFSIIEAIYIIYMLRFFKTKISINHPLEKNIITANDYFKHPFKSTLYESKICQFGKDASLLLGGYLILRSIFQKKIKFNFYNKIILALTFLFSLLNMNAFFYLIPFFIFELIIINKNFFD